MKNNVYFNSSFMDNVGFTTIKELLSNSCKFEENKKNPFDKSVVNAMANANVSMEIKKNKT